MIICNMLRRDTDGQQFQFDEPYNVKNIRAKLPRAKRYTDDELGWAWRKAIKNTKNACEEVFHFTFLSYLARQKRTRINPYLRPMGKSFASPPHV